MHAYYGVNQLNSASPTLLETVHQLESSSVIGPGGLYNNNGTVPSNEVPVITPFAVNGTIITSSFSGDAATLTSQHFDSLPSNAPDMAGYSSSSYFPPISTTPSLLFRSPSMYNQGACSMPSNPPLLPPTINSPPIQMAAPTTISSPSNSLWQHTIPVSMPWMSSPHMPTTIKFTAAHGRPTVCEMVKNDAMRAPKRRYDRDDEGFSEPGGKVHVNEERMAARMQELTLDNNNVDFVPDLEESWYAARSQAASAIQDRNGSVIRERDQQNERRSNSSSPGLPKLEVSDLLKMNFTTKEILPQVILDQINKPCMELVLWKPPGNFVTDVVNSITGKKPISSSSSSSSSSSPIAGSMGNSRTTLPSFASDVWSVNRMHDEGASFIDVDPAAVPLPDDDDMEL